MSISSWKKYKTLTDKPPIEICVNKIDDRITFKIKSGYYFDLSTHKTVELLGITNRTITEDKNSEDVLRLKITEVLLVNCNLVNNKYQPDLKVLYTFIPNKPFGQLLEISLSKFIF